MSSNPIQEEEGGKKLGKLIGHDIQLINLNVLIRMLDNIKHTRTICPFIQFNHHAVIYLHMLS